MSAENFDLSPLFTACRCSPSSDFAYAVYVQIMTRSEDMGLLRSDLPVVFKGSELLFKFRTFQENFSVKDCFGTIDHDADFYKAVGSPVGPAWS